MLVNIQKARSLPKAKRKTPKSIFQLPTEELKTKEIIVDGNSVVCSENEVKVIDADPSDFANEESCHKK